LPEPPSRRGLAALRDMPARNSTKLLIQFMVTSSAFTEWGARKGGNSVHPVGCLHCPNLAQCYVLKIT
jgi:hypothetical protein